MSRGLSAVAPAVEGLRRVGGTEQRRQKPDHGGRGFRPEARRSAQGFNLSRGRLARAVTGILTRSVADDIVILNSGRVVATAAAALVRDKVDLHRHLGIY